MEIKELSGLSWYQLTLDPGVQVHQALADFLEEKSLSHAFILSCVGSCSRVNLVFPETSDIPPVLGSVEYNGLFEINGIIGDVKRVGKEIKVHLHGSFTQEGKKVFGGAVREGTTIFKMAELVIAGKA
ncbi:DNA-binding protein [bacterium]|nr:DNA-binding protein [bacterium]